MLLSTVIWKKELELPVESLATVLSSVEGESLLAAVGADR